MITLGIIMKCLGFILVMIVLALCCIVVFGIVCWVLKTDVDITQENEKEEKV